MATPVSPSPTLVPTADRLPQVLPTERLAASGKPVRELRDGLRRINDLGNVWALGLTWVQAAVTIGFALVVGHPLAWVVAWLLMGPVHARFAILMHEAAHKLRFTSKRANDWVGAWLAAYPNLTPMSIYRRSHFAHHRDEFGPDEPDLAFYEGYPTSAATLRRRLWRDLRGNSGRKNLRVLIDVARNESGFGVARRIVVTQAALFVVLSIVGVAVAGWVGLATYPVLWLGSWMTVWKVINRLRSLAEHGGMTRSGDRRQTTHNIEQSLLARFWVVPFNTGWHLAHHVDMGIPWRNLPRFHDELVTAGYVTEELTHDSYIAFWRSLIVDDAGPSPA